MLTRQRKAHVEDSEVIDRDHATVQMLGDEFDALLLIRTEHARAQSVTSVVRESDGLIHSVVLHDSRDRREHYPRRVSIG